MALHKDLQPVDIHITYAFTYADAAARDGDTGRVTADIGKFARQLDNNSLWMLLDLTPTWIRIDAADAANLTSSAPADVTKSAAVVGVSSEAARADHKHDVQTGSPNNVSIGDVVAEGVSTSLARADHTHAVPAPAAPQTVGTVNTAGVSTSPARADHVHAHGNLAGGSLHADVIAAGASGFMTGSDKSKLDGVSAGAAALTSTPPVNVTKSAAVVGVGTTAARHDHKHDVSTAIVGAIAIGDAAAEGSATSLARSDHTHSLAAPAAPANVTKAAASAGVSTAPARADHKHDISTASGSALSVGGASAEGVATSLARSDHLHALPAFGTGAGTFCQGNDARLSDDRTASGLRSVTTVVSVSGAAAPTAGQVLTALGGTSATWQTVAGALKQTVFAEITVDTTTTSVTYVTLISQNITIQAGSKLLIRLTTSSSNSSNNSMTNFRLTVNGVVRRAYVVRAPAAGGVMPGGLVYSVSGLAAGVRTVLVEWQVSSGTGQIRPVTAPNDEHACLLIEEVAV